MIHLSLWLLIAAPIFLLHLRGSVIVGRHAVSTVNLWDHVNPELGSASGRRRIRDLFSLVLHLMIAAVLISMLSLLSDDSDGEGSDHVVILDTSPGMTANDAGVQRLDLARTHALQFVRTLPPGDPVALIDAAAEPRVVCRKTVDREMFISALTSLQASDGQSSPEGAVRLGKRILTEQSNARPAEGSVFMFTDGCGDFEWLSKSPENGVEWILVGPEDASNCGITSFQTRRRLNAPDVCDAFCRLNNSGSLPAKLRLDLTLDDELVDSIPCQIDSHSSATKEITFRDRNGGHLRLSVRRPADSLNLQLLKDDSLPADDFSEQELEPVPVIPVTLVSSQNRYLRAALESLPEVHLRIQEKIPDAMESREIVFLHKWVPKNLPGGRIVVIDPQSATDLWTFQGRMVQPRLQVLDTGHQLFRDISIESLLVEAAPSIRPQRSVESLGSYSDGAPFCFVRRRENGDVVVLAADIDESLITVRAAFPVLIRNILRYYSSVSVRPAERSSNASSDAVHVTDESEAVMMRASPLRGQIAEPSLNVGVQPAMFSGVLLMALLLTEWVFFHRQRI